jgi:hypothetical protein
VKPMTKACGAGAVMLGGLLAAPIAGGTESATRIIDRTVICRTAGVGYPDTVRIMHVSANPSSPARDTTPRVHIGNPAGGDPGVSAALSIGSAFGPLSAGGMWLSRTRCLRTAIRVSFSGRGLKGGQTDPFGDSYRCDIPARVVIRVRAVFKRPTVLARDPRSPSVDVARGQLAQGYLAVTAQRGREPIVFASVDDASGNARLFVARSRCKGP